MRVTSNGRTFVHEIIIANDKIGVLINRIFLDDCLRFCLKDIIYKKYSKEKVIKKEILLKRVIFFFFTNCHYRLSFIFVDI